MRTMTKDRNENIYRKKDGGEKNQKERQRKVLKKLLIKKTTKRGKGNEIKLSHDKK